jgi:hypothetical protein
VPLEGSNFFHVFQTERFLIKMQILHFCLLKKADYENLLNVSARSVLQVNSKRVEIRFHRKWWIK